jgi:hypothetical protein
MAVEVNLDSGFPAGIQSAMEDPGSIENRVSILLEHGQIHY